VTIAKDLPATIVASEWFGELLEAEEALERETAQADAAYARWRQKFDKLVAQHDAAIAAAVRSGDQLQPPPDASAGAHHARWQRALHDARRDLGYRTREALLQHADEVERAIEEEWRASVTEPVRKVIEPVLTKLKEPVERGRGLLRGLQQLRQITGTLKARPVLEVLEPIELIKLVISGGTPNEPVAEPPPPPARQIVDAPLRHPRVRPGRGDEFVFERRGIGTGPLLQPGEDVPEGGHELPVTTAGRPGL
jgi:hypothetical protein